MANGFMHRAEARRRGAHGASSAKVVLRDDRLWAARLDGRGATNPAHRCLHVSLLEAQEYGEQEFLFVPYSAFTVEAVQWVRAPTPEAPHRIAIFAANDNKAESEDLPVAPWF